MENNEQLPKNLPVCILLITYNRLNFLKKTKKKKLPYNIIPFDPFGVWKLFFTRFYGEKTVKNLAYYCVF